MIDQKIIEVCKKSDLQNIREVFEEASPLEFSVAFRVLGDEELAKEVIQDTMVTMRAKLKRINSTDSFKSGPGLFQDCSYCLYSPGHNHKKRKRLIFSAFYLNLNPITNHLTLSVIVL